MQEERQRSEAKGTPKLQGCDLCQIKNLRLGKGHGKNFNKYSLLQSLINAMALFARQNPFPVSNHEPVRP